MLKYFSLYSNLNYKITYWLLFCRYKIIYFTGFTIHDLFTQYIVILLKPKKIKYWNHRYSFGSLIRQTWNKIYHLSIRRALGEVNIKTRPRASFIPDKIPNLSNGIGGESLP